MNCITVEWEDGTYIVRQEGEFIKDTDDLHEALTFALAVSEHSGERVEVLSVSE